MKVIDSMFSSNSVIFNAIYVKGYTIPIYIDARKTLSHPRERFIVIQAMIEELSKNFPDCEMIAGTCTAGIPYASIIAHNLNLPMCYVRPNKKEKGLGNQIEGEIYKLKMKTVIIEDVIAHANSVINTAEVLIKEGAIIKGVLSVFTFNMEQAKIMLNKSNIQNRSLCSFEEIIEYAVKKKIILDEEVETLYNYRNNTPEYAWD